MNKFYVIRNKNVDAGFSSLLASVLGHLKLAEDAKLIPIIDWSAYKNKYSDKTFDNNWDYFFEPVSNYSVKDLTPDNVALTRESEPGNINFPYHRNFVLKSMFNSYLTLTPAAASFINNNLSGIDTRNVLGVHVRAAKEMRIAPNHPMQPSRRQIVSRIDQHLESNYFKHIFLATDSVDTLEFFIKRYGKHLIFFEAARFTGDSKFIESRRKNHGFLCGVEYLSDLFMLKSCRQFVSGYSGLSNMVVALNDSPLVDFTPELIWRGRTHPNKHVAKFHYPLKTAFLDLKIILNFE